MLTYIKILVKYPEGAPGTIDSFLTETSESEEALLNGIDQTGVVQMLIQHDHTVDHHQVGWLLHTQPGGINL